MRKSARSRPEKATRSEIAAIKSLFHAHYPDSKTELNYRNLYELTVSVMLSAQCTDKRVNLITPPFFARFPDIAALAGAEIPEITALIATCSFFNNKAKSLSKMAKAVMEKHGGEIPLDAEPLKQLDGIGQKTANVILIEYAQKDLMAVDTHVFRVAHRLGLSQSKSAKETESDLVKAFKTELHQLHQAMVLFGRYRCKAKNPECEGCFLVEYCKSREGFKAR